MNAKHRLLIVDQNPYVASILMQTLKKDFTVTIVNTGHDAARLLIEGNRFDCVLTELDLPSFSGFDLTKLIRTSRLISNMPVVVLSDALDSNTRIKCLEQGVDSCIAKPFNPLEVKAKLHAVLRRSASPLEHVQQRLASVQLNMESGSLAQLKSRLLSMLSRNYNVSQNA